MLVKNGRVLIRGKLVDCNLLLEDGRIRQITKAMPSSDEAINARGMVVMPGVIDPHVHFREPGFTWKEDFRSGSGAAAAGGVTTYLDMPNNDPPTTTARLLDEKRELAKKSVVNYGFHFGATGDNAGEIRRAKNIASVKVFMDISTGSMRIDSQSALKRVFAEKMVSVHAEGDNVKKAIGLARHKLYLCHLSSRQEISFDKRSNVYCEATPHHLFLTPRNDPFCLMKPALKDTQDREALWGAVKGGFIDTIGSDHAPHTIEEKQSHDPPYGVPGVETSLPLMLDAVNRRRLPLSRLVEMMCENPARIFGMNKGRVAKGFDADLTIVDLKMEKKIRNDELRTKCGWSPFDGVQLKGWPAYTIVMGRVAFDGDIVNNTGSEVEWNKR
ncbi:MAG: amidohydrolase family protein [archaeon]